MVKPYTMLTEAYNNTQTEFDTLEAATDMLDRLISKDKDPGARALYDKFAQDLQGVSEDLLKNGLSPNSRRTLHRLRSYYNKYITAIQNAVTAKQAQIKQLQTLQAADDSIIPERDILGGGREASLDRWLEDPNYTYGKVFSPRKDAEQKAKGVARDAATLRSAIAWANAERSDYLQKRRTYMHPAAATFFNMLEARQFDAAYRTLLRDYPLKGVTGLEYSGADYYAEGGYMDDEQGLPPFAMTWVDPVATSGGGGGGGATKPATSTPVRDSSPARGSTTPPAILQQRRGGADDRQERAEHSSSRSSSSDKKGGKKKGKKNTEGFKGLTSPYILLATPDIESSDLQKKLNNVMSTLGLPTDIDELRNFTFENYKGAPMPLAIATAVAAGPDPALSIAMDQMAMQDRVMGNPYGVAPILGPQIIENMYTSDRVPYFQDIKDLKRVTFDNRHYYDYDISDKYAGRHFLISPRTFMDQYSDYNAVTDPDLLRRSVEESYAGIKNTLNEYFSPTPITVKNGGKEIPTNPGIYTLEDIVKTRLDYANKMGPTLMGTVNLRYNDNDRKSIMNYLLNLAALNDDRVAIQPIEGWNKQGELRLGDNMELSEWGTLNEGNGEFEVTRVPEFFVSGNKNMKGLILRTHGNKHYFISADSIGQSSFSSALDIIPQIEQLVSQEQEYKQAIEQQIRKNNPNISDADFEEAMAYEFYGSGIYKEIQKEKRNFDTRFMQLLSESLLQTIKVPQQDTSEVSYDETEYDDYGNSIEEEEE